MSYAVSYVMSRVILSHGMGAYHWPKWRRLGFCAREFLAPRRYASCPFAETTKDLSRRPGRQRETMGSEGNV